MQDMLSLMNIIPMLIVALILVVVLSWILQISTKIICGEAIEFLDAFKTALIGVLISIGVGYVMPESFLLDLLITYAIWSLLIAMFVGLPITQTLLVAAVLKIIQLALAFVLAAIVALMSS